MKIALICLCLAFVGAVYALPAGWPQIELDEDTVWEPEVGVHEEDHGIRYKRASCDLFSFSSKWVTPNHAVCAAHCIARGNRGGSCQGTICHCRK